jgi:hypothetical protein
MGSNYPSILVLHNYGPTASTITLAAYDSVTGTSVGQVNQTIAANGTLTLPVAQLESLINFLPNSTQFHINIVVSNAAGGELPVRVTQAIRNAQFGGDINMSGACAINSVAPTVVQVPATVPTAYCGTILMPSPYTFIPVYFTASVAPNGRMEGTLYGESSGYYVGAAFTGTVSGNSFVASTIPSGGSAVGTINNGTLTGTSVSELGSGTITASTAACSN